MTPSQLLSQHINAKPPNGKPIELPDGSFCAVGGNPITVGYRVLDTVPKSYGRFMETFTGDYLSEEAAICLANDWNLGCRMVFEDGTHYHPLISKEQAEKQGRPCFSQIAREVWPSKMGQACVILIASDVKKRLWTIAQSGRLGSQTPVAILAADYDVEEHRWINWERLVQLLDFIEVIYSSGFSKDVISRNLMRRIKTGGDVDLRTVYHWEEQLQTLRFETEFFPALVIAQADESKKVITQIAPPKSAAKKSTKKPKTTPSQTQSDLFA